MPNEFKNNQSGELESPFYVEILRAYMQERAVTLEQAAKEFEGQILANPEDTANQDHLAELDEAVQILKKENG